MKVCWFNLNKQKQLRGVVYKLQQTENISQNLSNIIIKISSIVIIRVVVLIAAPILAIISLQDTQISP